MYPPLHNGGHSVDRRLSPQRQFSKNHQQRRSSSYSNRESPSRSRSSSSPEKSKSSRSSRSRSASSPEKTRRNKTTSNGIKRKLKAPDTPLSATPTCIPPVAPPPVYPHGRGPSPSCDPSHAPITATPLHKDWVSETSDYLSVMVLNVPYLNREFFGAPDCRHDDGVLWLMMIRQNVSRLSLIQLMLSLEAGEHVNITGVDLFPVTAVKISVSID